MRISDWSSDVCSSDLERQAFTGETGEGRGAAAQQDKDEVFDTRLFCEGEKVSGGGDAGLVRHRVARCDAFDPLQRLGGAVRYDGQAGERPLPVLDRKSVV